MNASKAALSNLPRVAAIATMASRLATFEKMLPVIHAQVEHVFIYLDGYASAPSFLEHFNRTTPRSYIRHASALHFAHNLAHSCHVHELGTGTCAFVSSLFDVDPRAWDSNDMDDIIVAIEAQRRGLPRIAVARAAGWLKAHAECQPDSLWAKAWLDDSQQSQKMRALLGLYA